MISPECAPAPLAVLAQAFAGFEQALRAVPGFRTEPDPVTALAGVGTRFQWRNLIGASPVFRRAHLEWLDVPDRFAVLHLCIFPHLHDPSPIFGFDVVAGQARATGLFLDLSPVLSGTTGPSLSDILGRDELASFVERRERPAWGSIFSADFLAIRPHSAAELRRGVGLAERALAAALAAAAARPPSLPDDERVVDGQRRYVAAQRCNGHTVRMLSNLVGNDAASRFVADSLFPEPIAGRHAAASAGTGACAEPAMGAAV